MQPAPISALCAIHQGVPATVVCARCGNFMCSTCSENGTQVNCPACRALNTDTFPYNADATLSELLNNAIEVFKRDPANILIGLVVFFGITMAGSFVAQIISTVVTNVVGATYDQTNPLKDLGKFVVAIGLAQAIAMAVNLITQALALSGYYRLLMDALIGRKADVSRMFSKLKDVGQFVILQLLQALIFTVPFLLIFGVVAFVAVRNAGFSFSNPSAFRPESLVTPVNMALFAGTVLLIMVFSVVVLPVTLFSVPELLIGNCTPIEAIRRSWALSDGQRLRVLGYTLVGSLLMMVGFIACCVGLFAAMPVYYLLILSLYLALRNSSTLPRPNHD
ncbi:MAG: hypothetical protein ACO1OB_29310 [Archangium sp.]